MFFHAGCPASGILDERLPVLGPPELVRLVLPAPSVFAGLSVFRALLSFVLASTVVLVAPLGPGNLSVGESSPG